MSDAKRLVAPPSETGAPSRQVAPGSAAGGDGLPRVKAPVWSLRGRHMVALAALIAIVLLVETVVLGVVVRRHLREEIEREAFSYATLAVGPVCDAYQTYFDSGASKFRELIQETANLDPDLSSLAIFGVEGKLLFHSDELGESGPSAEKVRQLDVLDEERVIEAVRGLDFETWREDRPSGQVWMVVAPWIEEWGRHRYSVVFTFSYAAVEEAVENAFGQLIFLGLVSLGLGLLFATVLSDKVIGPVRRLTDGARRLAEGDLHHRIEIDTGDELEVLGQTLSRMAARLSSTIEDLAASNRRLEGVNEELQQLDRVKSDLLANVSHELRTPLTAISGYVEALQAGLLGDLDATQQQAIDVMDRNIRRLRGMIDQLLSYSRMESGRLEVELQPFDLRPVATHVVEALRAIHGEEVDLVIEVQEGLAEVYGDPARIAQVLENLLTNAIKFTPEGRRIELRAREAGDGVFVEVRDQGIGIPAAELDRIFQRFHQVDATSKRKFGGMGLGLAIVKEILELNHSSISVESAPGKGSTFSFTLPFAAERTGIIPLVGRRRILIVDDDASFVHGLASFLSSHGFGVDTAVTADQGSVSARRLRPDVILLDRLLPDADGFDLLAMLRADPATRETPVIIITVRKERALGLRLGAADYLIKPVAPAEVEKTILEVTGAADLARRKAGS